MQKTSVTSVLCGVALVSASLLFVPQVADAAVDCSPAAVRCVGASQEYSTIQAAANAAKAGDTVWVFDGTYSGFVTAASGTATAPITFAAVGAQAVISSPASTGDGINVESTDYVVIRGFIVKNATRAGIRVAVSRGVTVEGNTVGPNTKWGIFTAFAVQVKVLNNKTFGSAQQHGIYVSNSDTASDQPVIRGNEAYSNTQNGIQLNGDCFSGGDGVLSGAIIENNRVHDNGNKGFSLISVQDSTIQNNITYANGTAGGAGGIHLADEPGCGNPSSRNLIVNNTVVESRIAAIRITDGASNVIFNNVAIGTSSIVDESGSGNSISGSSNYSGTVAGAGFVDASHANYHLASGSALIDSGVASFGGKVAAASDAEGVARPQGNGFDRGAYEVGVTQRAPLPPSNVRIIR